MSGIMNLEALLRGMDPVLDETVYVFATLAEGPVPPGLPLLLRFTEDEGETLILPREAATVAGLAFDFPCRRITLKVHSDLQAVGLTAAISAALTDAEIPANIVAGFYHDHLFVPTDKAEAALAALQRLSGTLR